MTEDDLSPIRAMPSGLCEDPSGEATALIGRMAQGDGQALGELFNMWAPVFLGISQRMLGDPKEAAAILRNTFIRMWRSAADYDSHRSPPFVWAFTILRELCIDRLHQRRQPKRPTERTPTTPLHSDIVEDPRVMPLDDWRRLRNALDSLPAEELGCLETAVLLGYARPEPTDPPSATVKPSLRRALDKIRNQLSRYEL